MAEFISICEQFTLKLLGIGERVVELVTDNIYDAFVPYLPSWVTNLLPEGAVSVLQQYSVSDLMFGAGIVFFIGYTLVKFLKA